MHKLLWDFEIQLDHLILTSRTDLVILSKKKKWTCWIVHLSLPVDYSVKLNENEKKDKYLDIARELKKTMEHKSNGDTNYNWCSLRVSHKGHSLVYPFD